MIRRLPLLASSLLWLALVAAAGAVTLPPGFQETIVFTGLSKPTAVRFSPDGRVFVAEKRGRIKVYSSLSDTSATIFGDLSPLVVDYWDRGLLGLALHPNFPTTPYVYILYTFDAPIGGTAPTWADRCPSPPGATTDGCVVSGRLSRLTASGDTMVPGSEVVFLEAWGMQFPSHSIGTLEFGAEGALYVSGGEGASFDNVDYGQYGYPEVNPIGDPPAGVGGTMTPPTAEGGALRSQSLHRNPGEPVLFDGAILRLDPATGGPLPSNPLYSHPDEGARRIIAYGLRNPFRFTIQPSTGSLFVGDVGWDGWEEINKVADPTDAIVENFGWPCYEGVSRQSAYESANLDICSGIYAAPGSVVPPYYAYKHYVKVVAGENCSATAGSAVSGLAFYQGGSYPAQYDGALFFADYSRNCAWVMFPGGNGQPDVATRATFIAGASTPVDLRIGPGGDLFYADISGGKIRRIQYFAPLAVATASPTSGPAPLTVDFDGSDSTPAQVGDTLTFAWDLDGDGQFDDSTAVQPQFVYTQSGSQDVRLRVTDNRGASGVSAPLTIDVGNTPPSATIDTPSSSVTWRVGQTINFSGQATDPQDGTVPASRLTWSLILHHCAADCHTHTVQTSPGVASGSFAAPDHEYPVYLEVQLRAEDSGGLTDTKSVLLYPRIVALSFQSSPSGARLVVGTDEGFAPFAVTAIVGSKRSVSAPAPQILGGVSYSFANWSDGGTQTHDVTAGSTGSTFTATFTSVPPVLAAVGPDSGPAPGSIRVTATGANFVAGASLTMGGVAASGVTFVNSTEIQGNAPALTPGTLNDVAVRNPSGATGTLPEAFFADFSDVPVSNAFHASIETIFRGAITAGCGGGNFCPGSAVTRAQIAVFLLRSKHGPSFLPPPATGSVFTDVPVGSFAAAWIEKLAADGITAGCGGGLFCPNTSIKREQMAVFLLRTEEGPAYTPPPATGVFADVPVSSPYARWIEELADRGITAGCGGGNYCPGASTTRGQMSVFLVQTFSLP